MVGEQALDLVRQGAEVGEVDEPDGAAAHLVLVGRADAAPGGADLGARTAAFAERVELAMERQDQGGVVGDAQVVAADRDALGAEPLDLGDEGVRIDHHAVADHRQLAGAHHAGGQQRELVGLSRR